LRVLAQATPKNHRSIEWSDETKRDVDASLPDGWNGTGRAREENSTADARRCTQIRTEPIRLTVAVFPGWPKQHGASALIGVHPRLKFFAWNVQKP
jgi:hypothetical protein